MKRGNQAAYYRQGQAALIATVFFLLVSLAILGSISIMSITHLGRARELIYARNSYTTAESGLEDMIFRITSGLAVASSETINLNKGSATVTDNGVIGGVRSIVSRGNVKNRFRNVVVRFSSVASDGNTFDSALNAGFLGVKLAGNTTITHRENYLGKVGNVYSNGSINASGGTADLITGSATIARSIANDVWANLVDFGQRNSDPAIDALISGTSPPLVMPFNETSAHFDIAQSFVAPITAYTVQAKVYMKRVNLNAPNIHAYIIPNDPSSTDQFGKPFTTNGSARVADMTLQGGNPIWSTNSWQWVTFQFNTSRPVIENEKYWLVLEGNEDTNQPINIGASSNDSAYVYGQNNCYGQYNWCNSTPDGYAGCAGGAPCFGQGTLKYSSNANAANPVWSAPGVPTDMAFRIFMGESTTGIVDNGASTAYVTQADSIDVCGDIYANTILGPTDVGKEAYYQNLNTGNGSITAKAIINNAPSECALAPAPVVCADPPGDTSGTPPCRDHDSPNDPGPNPIKFQLEGNKPWQQSVYEWKAIAQGAQTVGTQIISTGQDVTLTSQYINGYLQCQNTGKLRIEGGGIIYVKGGGRFENNCEIYVSDPAGLGLDAHIVFEGSDTSFNNGKVDVVTRAKFFPNQGSIKTGYIYVYSLNHSFINFDSQEPVRTIYLSTNAGYGGGVFFAPYGEIRIVGNAETISMAAAKLQALESSTVKYEDGVVGPVNPGNNGTIDLIPVFFEFHEIE